MVSARACYPLFDIPGIVFLPELNRVFWYLHDRALQAVSQGDSSLADYYNSAWIDLLNVGIWYISTQQRITYVKEMKDGRDSTNHDSGSRESDHGV